VLDLLVLMMLKSHPPDVVASSAAITACAKEHVWLEAAVDVFFPVELENDVCKERRIW
jgi:hypothetical protein